MCYIIPQRVKWTHLEQVQHCTDLCLLVTFPAHSKQERRDKIGMNIASHQVKKQNKNQGTGEEKRLATDFEDTECCPTAVVQRAAQ